MNRARRSFALSLLLAAASCSESSGRKPLACQLDTDCPSEAKCILGACVAGSLPQAKILVHASQSELVSHRDITFDGSQSEDTNPRGSVTQYAWSVKRGRTAACDPTSTAGSRSAFTTNFQCPGQYVVELQVTNDLKLQSLPEQATLEIAPSTNPPVITAIGPSASVGHRCEGSPLLCRAFDAAAGSSAFQLTVAATDVEDGSNLAYAWTYEPPMGLDATKLHVTFEPNANTPTPLVRIETDGAAIAGDWIFQAHVIDSNKLTSVKGQKLTVNNASPVASLDGAVVVLDHTYFLTTDRYVANATVHAKLSDDDGDPISSAQLSLQESIPTSCSFQVLASAIDLGGFTGKIELSCAGAASQELIGKVERALVLEATDVNGATVTDSRPLAVADAPPALTWSALGNLPGIELVTHSVVPCPAGAETPLCLAVDAPLPFTISDRETDPVSVSLSAVGLPASGAFFSAGGGRFSLLVPVTKAGLLAGTGPSGSIPIMFRVAASDPWASAVADFGLAVGNHAPVVAPLPAPTGQHGYSQVDHAYHATFDFATATDLDGDPLTATASSSDLACAAAGVVNDRIQVTCSMPYDPASGPPTLGAFLFPRVGKVHAVASDPWTSSPMTPEVLVSIQNRPPTVAYPGTVVNAPTPCVCKPSLCQWAPEGMGTADFDPLASDPDGDPLHLTITFANGAASVDKVCFGSDCAVSFSVPADTTATLTITDGVSPISRSYPVVRTCSNDTSQPCAPASGFCR